MRAGHGLWPQLEPDDRDLVVDKHRFSALIQGSSNLQSLLDERGIDTLVIVGTLTNVCCESTARDAMMLNYRVIMVDDANATISEAAHRASLDNVAMFFGDVQTTEQVLGMLRDLTTKSRLTQIHVCVAISGGQVPGNPDANDDQGSDRPDGGSGSGDVQSMSRTAAESWARVRTS